MDGHNESGVMDLAALAEASTVQGPAWAYQCEDLNVNLLVFEAGDGVNEHVNAEVDVLLVGVAGEGVVEVDGAAHTLGGGHAVVIAKGTTRAIHATTARFAYLSCHQRRAGLWPRRATSSRRRGQAEYDGF